MPHRLRCLESPTLAVGIRLGSLSCWFMEAACDQCHSSMPIQTRWSIPFGCAGRTFTGWATLATLSSCLTTGLLFPDVFPIGVEKLLVMTERTVLAGGAFTLARVLDILAEDLLLILLPFLSSFFPPASG